MKMFEKEKARGRKGDRERVSESERFSLESATEVRFTKNDGWVQGGGGTLGLRQEQPVSLYSFAVTMNKAVNENKHEIHG